MGLIWRFKVYEYETSASLAGNQTGSFGAPDDGRKPHIDRKIAYFLSGVNPGNENSSKVVDSNGEPLVVYHGKVVSRGLSPCVLPCVPGVA